ncbi:MAG: signal peptidase [Actinomycetota bacterium]|nr:signal peptidase [Actinomycetota bacterium]
MTPVGDREPENGPATRARGVYRVPSAAAVSAPPDSAGSHPEPAEPGGALVPVGRRDASRAAPRSTQGTARRIETPARPPATPGGRPEAPATGAEPPARGAHGPSRSDRRRGADERSRGGRAPDRIRPRHRAIRTRRPMPFWQELPLLLLIALCLALLIKTFLVQAFFIPSGSMENTLRIRDRVLVNKLVYDVRDPVRGEVIVFRGTDSWDPEPGTVQAPSGMFGRLTHGLGELVGVAQPDERDFVKRVIGLPGDTVRCCDSRGRITVNDVPLDEPYVFDNTPAEQRPFGPVNVPAGRLFVMGDHRHVSADSRQYLQDRWQGTVPVDQVIGRAFVKVWPTEHWGLLPVPATFEAVPTALAPRERPASPEPPGVPALFVAPLLVASAGGSRTGRGLTRSPRRSGSAGTSSGYPPRRLWK